ncbi:MAG TPA: FAD-binding protein [Prochlorococcus sp.]
MAGVFNNKADDLPALMRSQKINPKPLLVCSGGTSSRCAADGHWTLDLRKSCCQIHLDTSTKNVELGAGQTMAALLSELKRYGRSFPSGLSGLPGLGYILTGGISPLSRSQGLAIDQIVEIKGVWGNGESFVQSKPEASSSLKDQLTWRGLCGAAPFLAVITGLKLQTQPLKPLRIWQSKLPYEQLIDLIHQAETWPQSMSLQWIWGDAIHVYGVNILDDADGAASFKKLQETLPCNKLTKIDDVAGLHELPPFMLPTCSEAPPERFHSELVALLSYGLGDACHQLMGSLAELMAKRPDPRCYLAAQQLGGVSSQQKQDASSFIHRQAIWKPWITAAWPAGDSQIKALSLNWLEKVWATLEPYCEGVHLAQMHPHLPWHQRELKAAFGEWLPGLQELKACRDPYGILPPL